MKRLLLFCSLLLCVGSAQAQVITTIAGNGTSGSGGDGGIATSAQLDQPYAVAADDSGNVYIADFANARIRKVNTSGIISTFAGGGASVTDGVLATSSAIGNPSGVAIDRHGNIYIAGGNRVRMVDTAGIIHTAAGGGLLGLDEGGIATDATLSPYGVAVDKYGNLYITDPGADLIRKVDTFGIITTIAGNGSTVYTNNVLATTTGLFTPWGVAVDNKGNVYETEYPSDVVHKIDTFGIITIFAGNGMVGYNGDHIAATAAKLFYPYGVATDKFNNVYIADHSNQRVRKVDTLGVITTVAGNGAAGSGGDGGSATAANLFYPYAIAANNIGSIYIADYSNNKVRAIINHTPVLVGGGIRSLSMCQDATAINIDTMLTALDVDAGQLITWSILTDAAHGIINGGDTATSPGSAVTPVGFTYIPFAGYTGPDTLTIRVSDGNATATMLVAITILPAATGGVIMGIDSICPGDTMLVTDTITGGVWSSLNVTRATITADGVVTGASPGSDIIIYTVTNTCGTASAYFPVTIRPLSMCNTGIAAMATQQESFSVHPNPTNGDITLQLSSATNEPVQIIITNIVGEKVLQQTVSTNTNVHFSLKQPPGVYFLSASAAHSRYTAKVIVE